MNRESKAKHTAGKWDIRYGTPDPENDNCFHNSIEVDGCNIADVWASDIHICKTPAECNANARLIAASPEMYEMLKSCLAFVDVLDLHGIVDNWSERPKLVELIKKIEG